MLHRLFVFYLLLLGIPGQAQVTLNMQLPPSGLIQKDQLWNLVLMNNSTLIPDAVLMLDLQDAQTGQTIVSASSRSFSLGKGVKLINIRDVQPLQYNYLAAELSGLYLPLGNYIACYRLLQDGSKDAKQLGDECVRVTIAPLSPPLLVTPADQSVLTHAVPQFSWTAPTPSDLFTRLNYDLVVAEILPGQSAVEAVSSNTPVFTRTDLTIPFASYGKLYTPLEKGKTYAWQVTARNGMDYSVQTDTWSFSIQAPDSVTRDIVQQGYVTLGGTDPKTAPYTVAQGVPLLVKYYSYHADHTAIFRVENKEGQLIYQFTRTLRYGDNYFACAPDKKLQPGMTYQLVYTDPQQQKVTLPFHIQ